MDRWRETVENGVHEFRRDFDGVCGVTLTITKLDVPGAWACVLLDGKRVVGELRTVREAVERIITPFRMRWLLRTQERWARVVPENLASAQSENELQRMILRGMAQGARISDIARSLGLSRAQACQLHKAALMAKAVPVLIYFKERD